MVEGIPVTPDLGRRKIVQALIALPPVLASGAVALDIGSEAADIARERNPLEEPAQSLLTHPALTELHETYLNTKVRFDNPEYGVWHTLQVLALLNSAKFATNQLFVTPQELESTVTAVKRTSGLAIARSNDPEFNEMFYGQSHNELVPTLVAMSGNAAATLGFYFAATRPKNRRKRNEPQVTQPGLTRRKFFKYLAWTTSLASAVPAIHGNVLQPHFDRIDNLYRGLPTRALKDLQDPTEFKKLDEFIRQLSLPSPNSHLPLDPEIHKQITQQIFEEYSSVLLNRDVPEYEKFRIKNLLRHAGGSFYEAYALRLRTINEIIGMAVPQILKAEGSDPLLTTKEIGGNPDGILNIGVGLIINNLVQTLQTIHHPIDIENFFIGQNQENLA